MSSRTCPWHLHKIARGAVAGTVAGLGAGLAFATAHAFIIVPIWDRMYGGLFGASVTGAVVGWAYVELLGDEPRPAGLEVARGALFGALLWLAVVPVTLVDVALRQLPRRTEFVEVSVAVALALIAGGLWGRLRTGRWRGTLAGAAATLALTLAMSGPVPIANGRRALGIFLGVFPASVVAGAILGLALSLARRRVPVMAP